MRPLIALVLSLVLAACGSSQVSPSASDLPGVHAAGLQAPYLVTLTLPKATWSAKEPITGAATLALAQGAGVDLGGSGGGLLFFQYASVDGTHNVGGAMTADCRAYRLEPGVGMSAPLSHSGGFSPEQPDFEFLRTFLTAPDVRLPAGDWKMSAVADFVEGQDCSGASRRITATVTIHVNPVTGPQ
jgi:hypothetical protein